MGYIIYTGSYERLGNFLNCIFIWDMYNIDTESMRDSVIFLNCIVCGIVGDISYFGSMVGSMVVGVCCE